jgi:hypothetical protein
MRLYEFANAEEQLALLRTIIDNTWTAIAQQADQQRINSAQGRPQPLPLSTKKIRSTVRTKKSKKVPSVRVPVPGPPHKKKPQVPVAMSPPHRAVSPTPQAFVAPHQLPPSNIPTKVQSVSTATTPNIKQIKAISPLPNSVKSSKFGTNGGYFGKNLSALRK